MWGRIISYVAAMPSRLTLWTLGGMPILISWFVLTQIS
jgi:hypothetical protein